MRRSVPADSPPVGATPALIRWGAVVGGGVIGLSLFGLLTALWQALAFGAEVEAIAANLDWFLTGSVIVTLFVGGLLAGWLSGVPGFAPGLFNGITVWAVALLVSVAVAAPAVLQTIGIPATEQAVETLVPNGGVLWAGFVALLVGAIAAGLGGGIGGLITRPAFVYAAPTPTAEEPAPSTQAAAAERTIRIPDEDRAASQRA